MLEKLLERAGAAESGGDGALNPAGPAGQRGAVCQALPWEPRKRAHAVGQGLPLTSPGVTPSPRVAGSPVHLFAGSWAGRLEHHFSISLGVRASCVASTADTRHLHLSLRCRPPQAEHGSSWSFEALRGFRVCFSCRWFLLLHIGELAFLSGASCLGADHSIHC